MFFHHSWLLSGSFDGTLKVLDILHGGVLCTLSDAHHGAPMNTMCTLQMIRPERTRELTTRRGFASFPVSPFPVVGDALYSDDGHPAEEAEAEEEAGEDGASSWAMDGRAWLSAGDDGRLRCWYVSSVKYTAATAREPLHSTSPSSSSSEKTTPALSVESARTPRKMVVVVEPVGRPQALVLRHLYDKFDGSERTVLRLYRLPHHSFRSPKDTSGVSSASFSLTTTSSVSGVAQEASPMTTEVLLSTSGAESKVLLFRLGVAPYAEKESDQLWTEALCWFTNPMTGPLYNMFPSLFFSALPQDDPVLHLYAHSLDGTIVWATVDMIWRNHKRWKTHVETNTIPTTCASFSFMSRVLTKEVGEKLVKDLHFTRLTWRGEEEEKNRSGEDPKDKRDHHHHHHRHSHRRPPSLMEGFFVCSPSLPNAYVLLPSSATTS